MSEVAWLSDLKTAGTEFAACSRVTITTERSPYWFRANDGRDGILLIDAPIRPAKFLQRMPQRLTGPTSPVASSMLTLDSARPVERAERSDSH
jgi:hypothetical protein